MSDWKPGDVAMIPFGKGDTVAIYTERSGWVTADNHASGRGYFGVRPLVVIDPESAEDVKRLADLYWDAFYEAGHHGGREARHITGLAAALREFAAPTPPKPAEPTGRYAVVEDQRGAAWCLTGWDTDYPWQAHYQDGSAESTTYAQIDAVRVLSEGVPQ